MMAKRFLVAFAMLALALAAGCGGASGVKHGRVVINWKPNTVALVPYVRVVPATSQEDVVSSPLTRAAYTPGPISKDAEASLDEALAKSVAKFTGFSVVPQSELWPVYQRYAGGPLADTPRRALVAMGRQLKVDAMLVGYVYRFRERDGGAAAADRPASVAFDLAMVRVKDGMVIWKSSFDHTQRPVSDNLLNLGVYAQHGLKWLTAAEFSAYGMDEIWRGSPWVKRSMAAPKDDK